MSIELPRKIKRAGTTILPIIGLLLVFVWTYLEKVLPINTKQELPTIYLIQFVSSAIIIIVALSAFSVFLLVWRFKEKPEDVINKQPNEENNRDIKQSFEEQLTYEILSHILQIKGLSQRATPRILASALDYKPELILSHLNDLHNAQFVTFYSSETDGKSPNLDTDFFLSPKAFEIIKIDKVTQQVNQGETRD
jgi:hypothetical protein